jgi:hypothetical protein
LCLRSHRPGYDYNNGLKSGNNDVEQRNDSKLHPRTYHRDTNDTTIGV